MPERVRVIVSMGLFVILSGFVAFSAIRLGWLLWQRFSGLACALPLSFCTPWQLIPLPPPSAIAFARI